MTDSQRNTSRTSEKADFSILHPIKRMVQHLKNPAEKNSTNNLHSLAQHPEIFVRLVEYADDPDADHRIIFRSFSKVKEDDIVKMGVKITPDIPFSSLAHAIRRSSLTRDFQFEEVLGKMQLNPVLESFGDGAFESQAENRACVGIHKIMSKIIDAFQAKKAFLVEEQVIIARLRSKVPPVEIRHASDGVANSTFLTGVLDFLCCSSNVEALQDNPRDRQEAFEEWQNSRTAAVQPKATWKNINAFLLYVEDRARAFDRHSDGPLSEWQLLIIEAKSMTRRSTSESRPENRVLAPGLDSEVQKLFFLDPDQWLHAHKNLNTLLPTSDNDTCAQLDHVVLDRYLSTVWHSLKHSGCQARYMPFDFLKSDAGSLSNSKIDSFRTISGLPTLAERRNCPLEPVIRVIYHNGQYLVIVVPHETRNLNGEKWIYILGSAIGSFDQYADRYQLGEGSWKRLLTIGEYHGWDMGNYNVYHISWNQNDGNGGPIACAMTRSILKNGFSLNRGISTYWCTHSIRLEILTALHTFAMQNLARFPEIQVRRNQSATQEYSQYFGSRLEGVKQRLEEFWNGVSDLDSKSGFMSISKKLTNSMVTCQHCNIKFARDGDDDTDTNNDGNPDYDDEDELEMQEVEDYVLSGRSTPDLSVHSLADGVHRLDISGSPSNLSAQCDSTAPKAVPQRSPKQRSLKKYVYQAIAESLATCLAPKPERFQENVMKFCVSSSEDWIFGVIDCTQEDRPCYITDTLTHRFSTSQSDSPNYRDIITLLITWMCTPAKEILPYMRDLCTAPVS